MDKRVTGIVKQEVTPIAEQMFSIELWTRNSDDKDLWVDFTTLLAEYFALHKNPMSRFDISHLFNFWNSMRSFPAGVFVAYVEGNPVGCVMIETMEPRPTRPYGHEISRLFVRDRYRNKGIGRALMRGAVQRLADAGVGTAYLLVDTQNVPAVTMYESMGFVVNQKAAEKGTDGVLYLEASVDQVLSPPAAPVPAPSTTPPQQCSRSTQNATMLTRLAMLSGWLSTRLSW